MCSMSICSARCWTVYGMGLDRPANEKSPLAPLHEPHVWTKAEGDRLVQRMIAERNLPAVIVRPGTFICPGDRLHFGRSADRLRAGKGLIVGPGRNALPFIDVADVVQGMLLALDQQRALGQIYNLTTDEPMTQEEYLRATAKAVGANPLWIHVPYHSLYAAAVVAERAAKLTRMRRPLITRLGVALFGTSNRHAIDKARLDLGYSPTVPMREGVQRAAAWYRQERVRVRIAVPPDSG